MHTIFDTTSLRGIVLKNRVFRSATWLGMAGSDGLVTDAIVDVYRTYAQGQVGAIITGFTSISPYDGPLPGAMRLSHDSHVEGHKRITAAVHAEGSPIFLQAALLDTFVPDAAGHGVLKSVNALTREDLRSIVQVYREAALRAEKAGYDGLQIHAAHFFGLSKCLSPLCNQRQDEYGGCAEGRARLLVEIYDAVRQAVGQRFVILIKINCSDFSEGGLTQADFLTACELLARVGIDAIEVSGNYTSRPHVRPDVNEAYFRDAALRLKALVSTPVILVGGLRSLKTVNELVNKDGIDYVALSRPLICEPNLVARWQAGDTRPSRCLSCNACYHTPDHQCVQRLHGQEA
ncbi:MAG: NADH:flavin oxidoreductase [Desulfovibrio sp.]|nr:NADH:flavin oxidoreductase [Desulfovibrio sp.]